jgi:hypothetical protein
MSFLTTFLGHASYYTFLSGVETAVLCLRPRTEISWVPIQLSSIKWLLDLSDVLVMLVHYCHIITKLKAKEKQNTYFQLYFHAN